MSRRSTFPQISPPSRRHWAAWLVVALLWAQGLGLWHHTVHAPGLPEAVANTAAAAEADYVSPWHHAASSADCRLVDQLLLADGLTAPALEPAEPPAAPVLPAVRCAEPPTLGAAQPYQARAPPRLG